MKVDCRLAISSYTTFYVTSHVATEFIAYVSSRNRAASYDQFVTPVFYTYYVCCTGVSLAPRCRSTRNTSVCRGRFNNNRRIIIILYTVLKQYDTKKDLYVTNVLQLLVGLS